MELSKGRCVLEAALVEVGPPSTLRPPRRLARRQRHRKPAKGRENCPAQGVEFGASEVFYLEVRDKDRTRVAELNSAPSHQLQVHLQELRNTKAQSMIDELCQAVQVAKTRPSGRDQAIDTVLEREVGSEGLSFARCWIQTPATPRSAAPFRKSRTKLRQFR